MNLRNILDLVTSTTADHWYRPPHEPMGSGVGIAEFDLAGAGLDDMAIVNVRRHYHLATHLEHPHLAIAWGLPWRRDLHLPTISGRMADPSIHSELVDVCWYGASVYRTELMDVDGGRCLLPIPHPLVSSLELQDDPEVIAEQVGTWELALARLVDQLGGHREFDRYVRQAGLIEVDRHPLDPGQR